MEPVVKETLKKDLLQRIEKLQQEAAALQFEFDKEFKWRAEALSRALVELNNLNNAD
jgi:hypothetical protein